jgi:putative DNA primase/helicase
MNDLRIEFFNGLQTIGAAPASPSQLVADGRLHRHRIEGGKPGSMDGWHVIHCDAPPSAAGGNWKTGARVTWTAKSRQGMSAQELATLRQRMAEDKARAQAEQERRHRDAAQRAAWIWEHAQPASPRHPYLGRKGISPGIARQSGDALALPVCGFDGALHGVQYIQPDGTKRFLAGMSKTTHFIPATDELPDGSRPLWLAEGWATASYLQSQRQAVDVVAGLDAGNLQSVALAARQRWPKLQIVICPDFDSVGQAKGKAAAIAARAHILPMPDNVPPGCTDWLDLANLRREVAHG